MAGSIAAERVSVPNTICDTPAIVFSATRKRRNGNPNVLALAWGKLALGYFGGGIR